MRIDPVNHGLMMHAQMAGNPPEIHPIHIPAHRLLPHCIAVAGWLGVGRVLALAMLTFEALTPGFCASNLDLFIACLTIRTWFHTPILSCPLI